MSQGLRCCIPVLLKIYYALTEWSDFSSLSPITGILMCPWLFYWWDFPLSFLFDLWSFYFKHHFSVTFPYLYIWFNSIFIFSIAFDISFASSLWAFIQAFYSYPLCIHLEVSSCSLWNICIFMENIYNFKSIFSEDLFKLLSLGITCLVI